MVFARLMVVLPAAALLLYGCLPGAKPPDLVALYGLEYRLPVIPGTPSNQPIRIDRFSVAQTYNSKAMIYRSEAYRLDQYNYDQWRTNPGDMATDYLLRDFRTCGLFEAVFSYRQPEETRFMVEGGVEELVQTREKDGWKVALSLLVTLFDEQKQDIAQKIVFQKRYRNVQPITDRSAESFARGASEAMAKISEDMIKDVYKAVATYR